MAEFKQFTEQQPAFKVLKPWWDVLAEYLTVAMLMIGVFGCTLQVKEQISKGVSLVLEVAKPPKSPKKREKEPGHCGDTGQDHLPAQP